MSNRSTVRVTRKEVVSRRRKLLLALIALFLLLSLVLIGAAIARRGKAPSGGQETFPASDTSGHETEPDTLHPESAPPESSPPESGADPGSEPADTAVPPPDTETSAPETEAETGPEPTYVGGFTFPEEMASRFALMIDLDHWTVLAEKNADSVTYPASITKIMTVLLAAERLPDPDAVTSISAETIADLISRNAARAGFAAGEQITVRDMEAAALLPSGADAAVGLAELVSGSEEAFAELMNERAAEIGMKDTHFVTCTGLHRDTHVSTCSDLALLVREALKNETFRSVFSLRTYTTSKTKEHPWGISCPGTMFRGLELQGFSTDRYVGGKTGYTPEAGLCLASVAKIGGTEYLLITLGAGNGSNQPQLHISDADLIWSAFEVWLAER